MDDAALVAAMVARDPRGLEGAYRAYAAALLAYCRTMLSDREAAADVVHDTFVLAGQRAGQLREPDRLRAWLYAIARNECLRQLRGRARQAPLEEAGDVAAPTSDLGTSVQAEQVRELVWSAAAALNPGDRHLFELMVRHGLSGPDIASVLGVSADHAHARLSRARAQLERALGVLLVARTGAADCAELASLLRGWNGVLNALLRKRIGRHIDGCDLCTRRQRDELRPAALLSAYAALPFLAPPVGLWQQIQLTSATPEATIALARRAGRYDRDTGFPPTSASHGGRRLALAAAGIAVLVTIGVTVMPSLASQDRADVVAATPTAAAPTAANPAVATASGAVATPEPATPLPGHSPRPFTGGPTQPPPTTAAPTPSPSLTTTVYRVKSCPKYRFTVVASVTGRTIKSGTLFWSIGGSAPVPTALIHNGDVWQASVANLTTKKITWWVQVTTTDNLTLATSPSTATSPCP